MALAIAVVVALLLLAAVALMALDSLPVPVGCGSVTKTDTTLSANVGPCLGDGLVISRSGVTLDCAGHTISGTGTNDTSLGINLTVIGEATVKNRSVTEFRYGFYLVGSHSSTLTGNIANKNRMCGFTISIVGLITQHLTPHRRGLI
jgi:parallel beta-helix repeat protein